MDVETTKLVVFTISSICLLLGTYVVCLIADRDVKKWTDRDNTEYFTATIMKK